MILAAPGRAPGDDQTAVVADVGFREKAGPGTPSRREAGSGEARVEVDRPARAVMPDGIGRKSSVAGTDRRARAGCMQQGVLRPLVRASHTLLTCMVSH